MTVLVTRPGEQGLELCALLSSTGLTAIHHPLIQITENADDLTHPALSSYDLIIAVSQHAVDFAHQKLSRSASEWPKHIAYLAVGQKTAQHLSKVVEQVVHYPHVSDSEHLLQLPELNSVSGKRILILRGNGGRELIKQQLEHRGAHVTYWETYQRDEMAYVPNDCIQQWKQCDIKQVVVTSSEQLDVLCKPLSPKQLTWLSQLELFVPSKRISEHAKRLGFTRVVCTGSASNHDLLATLQPK